MNDTLTELAAGYFDYLAKSFPVMCASDEFHFLPRAQRASHYYDALDDLDPAMMAGHLSRLKEFRRDFELRETRTHDLEDLIDLSLLKASVAGILIELETKQSWRHNPLLYLKIGFLGLDQALTRPASGPAERTERAVSRLAAIPRLLVQAMESIHAVPSSYHQAGCAMSADCADYLRELGAPEILPADRLPEEGLESALSALSAFGKFLRGLTPVPDHRFPSAPLEETLRDHFLSARSLAEIFEISVEEWQENQDLLLKLQRRIDPEKSWRELYHDYEPADIGQTDTITLYEREIEALRVFFQSQGFTGSGYEGRLVLCPTPTYLRSVRSAASFSAALCGEDDKDFFYITLAPRGKQGTEDGNLLKRRLHREYKFLSAHETIPGHHLLDATRRNLSNPVRRQTESPLFYEGWAYYAESLLAEYGYVNSPIESLVDCKRRLWRAARCQIDVGLPTGRLSREEAVGLLTAAGFSPKEANTQIDRFRLNPGYQLCYSLGRHEIMRLRELYGPKMGREAFHKELLEGGELPFHLIEKRFEAAGANHV
jgi:hypothetical protein